MSCPVSSNFTGQEQDIGLSQLSSNGVGGLCGDIGIGDWEFVCRLCCLMKKLGVYRWYDILERSWWVGFRAHSQEVTWFLSKRGCQTNIGDSSRGERFWGLMFKEKIFSIHSIFVSSKMCKHKNRLGGTRYDIHCRDFTGVKELTSLRDESIMWVWQPP